MPRAARVPDRLPVQMARFSPGLSFALLIVGSFAAACGNDEPDDSSPDGDGGATAGGGASAGAPSGGTPAQGGTGGVAGDGGTAGSGPFVCIDHQAANDPDPGGSAEVGADCCGGLGTCTAPADLASDSFADSYGIAGCNASAGLRCAPKPSDQLPLMGVSPPCTLSLGALSFEGRCLPRCFVVATPGASNLGAGDCATDVVEDVVCAPCFSPLDGEATGACTRNAGDVPVEPPPGRFAECGQWLTDDAGSAPYMGYCVAEKVVTSSGQSPTGTALLPRETCAAGEICVPKTKVEDAGYCFEVCEQPLAQHGDAVCVPTYIVEAPGSPGQGYSGLLGRLTCREGETCAPCVNPLSTDGTPTGACEN